jgi:pilus assembly protein Flp/PilA
MEGYIMKAWKQFIRSEDGATAIEYGLIAAGISVAIAAVVFLLGDQVFGAFDTVNTTMEAGG